MVEIRNNNLHKNIDFANPPFNKNQSMSEPQYTANQNFLSIFQNNPKWRPSQPPYLIISCSRSSSSRCLFKTSSIIFLSSSLRWVRSGIGGRDGRRVVAIFIYVKMSSFLLTKYHIKSALSLAVMIFYDNDRQNFLDFLLHPCFTLLYPDKQAVKAPY